MSSDTIVQMTGSTLRFGAGATREVGDFERERVKTGIANRYMRPTPGILDPENTRTCPQAVAASAGLDVLSHVLESYHDSLDVAS